MATNPNTSNNTQEIKKYEIPVQVPQLSIENRTGLTRSKKCGIVVPEVVCAQFSTADLDNAGAANTTVAAHGTGIFLPAKAIIINAWVDVVTTFTSAADSATIAIKAEGTGDLVAGIAISDASNVWDAGLHGLLPGSYAEATVSGDTAILDAARKAASFIKTTVEREIIVTVGVQALTAGKMNIFVEYVLSD